MASYNSPPRSIRRWVALGDCKHEFALTYNCATLTRTAAFSAGPGTGSSDPQDEGQCFRRDGAYPPLLQSSKLFQDYFQDPDFIFKSCTGNTIAKVIETQLQSIFPNTSIVTVSIGGNESVHCRSSPETHVWLISITAFSSTISWSPAF